MREDEPAIDIGIAMRAMPSPDNAPCGDVGFASKTDGHYLLTLIDGLGHGSKAHRIADLAREEVLKRDPLEPLDEMMSALIKRFRGDHGFVAMICRISTVDDQLEFCGIGNIAARLFTGIGERTLISGPGIVGQYSARPLSRSLTFPSGSILVLHSDGISSNLHASELYDFLSGPSQNGAQRLVDRYARDYDDAGVIVARRLK